MDDAQRVQLMERTWIAEAKARSFLSTLNSIAAKLNAQHHPGPTKRIKSILNKVKYPKEDYSGDIARVKDLLRTTLVFNDVNTLRSSLSELGDSFPIGSLRISQDRISKPLPSGYRDMLLNIKLPALQEPARAKTSFNNVTVVGADRTLLGEHRTTNGYISKQGRLLF